MTTASSNITIARRFRGPPNSANGGYVAGRLAAFIEGPAEVTLYKPPPLDRPLDVCETDDGWQLVYGDSVLASAKPTEVTVSLDVAPAAEEAAQAAARTFDAARHRIPGCFVCGPERTAGDGLRLHPGPVDPDDADWTGMLASAWTPSANLGDAAGRLRPEFAWAALDCPTAYACASPAGMLPVLLGRQSVAIAALPRVGETCVVIARRLGRDGRKLHAEAALHGSGGEQLAVCRATWIEISEEQLAAMG